MKYHITITDNETGETRVDQDTCCIIVACDNGPKTRAGAFTDCNSIDLASTVAGALGIAYHLLKQLPRSLRRKTKKLAREAAREEARKNA